MPHIRLIPALFLASFATLATAAETNTFKGAWFDVAVPSNFTPTPSLNSTTSDGFDSTEFVSPDGSVSFYVYAPQWTGNPDDIELNANFETIIDERETVAADGTVNRWWTITANDGSYARSYHEIVTLDGTSRQIVGIKYQNSEVLSEYASHYKSFKESLTRYADN
jgi:hypothetical protein